MSEGEEDVEGRRGARGGSRTFPSFTGGYWGARLTRRGREPSRSVFLHWTKISCFAVYIDSWRTGFVRGGSWNAVEVADELGNELVWQITEALVGSGTGGGGDTDEGGEGGDRSGLAGLGGRTVS